MVKFRFDLKICISRRLRDHIHLRQHPLLHLGRLLISILLLTRVHRPIPLAFPRPLALDVHVLKINT